MPTTVLDPGHGGGPSAGGSSALGVRGPAGTLEKDVTMALARIVAAHLGGDVRLTRRGDENPTLEARARTARQSGARVFLSLHANRGARGARGGEAWVHPRGGSEERARVLHTQSLAIHQELGNRSGVAGVRMNLGSVAIKQGDYIEGRAQPYIS